MGTSYNELKAELNNNDIEIKNKFNLLRDQTPEKCIHNGQYLNVCSLIQPETTVISFYEKMDLFIDKLNKVNTKLGIIERYIIDIVNKN